MQSVSWAVKYRPRKLDHVVGQKESVQQIRGMIKNGRVPHALLVHGYTGSGKTTLARIIANEINETSQAKDVLEINVGDQRGIDNIREIVSSTKFLGFDKFKIIILDEVHQLTQQGASALLKSLEEPPKHVVWILVTDQPEKLLPTIQNRCVKIQLNMLQPPDVLPLLLRVCKKEELDIPKKVLKNLAETTGGQPRDSLQMLQAVADSINGGSNPKKALKEAIKLAYDDATDSVAIKSLCYMYIKKNESIIKLLARTNDYNGLLNKMLDLNGFIMDVTIGIEPKWYNVTRKRMQATMKQLDKKPDFKRLIEVHNKLVDIKTQMFTFAVNEYDLLRAKLGSS